MAVFSELRHSLILALERHSYSRHIVTNPEPKPIQFSLKRLFVIVLLAALVMVAVRFVGCLMAVPDDAYSMWGAGDLVLDYMESNDGAWPKSWDELAAICEEKHEGYTMGGPVATLQQRVAIDFMFDPEVAMAAITEDAASPSFRVIYLRNGSRAYWEGMEPNQRVFDYLKRRKFGGERTQLVP